VVIATFIFWSDQATRPETAARSRGNQRANRTSPLPEGGIHGSSTSLQAVHVASQLPEAGRGRSRRRCRHVVLASAIRRGQARPDHLPPRELLREGVRRALQERLGPEVSEGDRDQGELRDR